MNETMQEKLSGKRTPLIHKLPLDIPMSIQIGVTNACNLKCEFCEQSSDKFRKIPKHNLDLAFVEKLAADIKKSGKKLNQVLLTGIGEPLINPKIADMVQIIAQYNIADRIGIITNGTLLNRELSDACIDAGLNILRVSLNGLSDDDYKRYTGVSIDFNKMYDNLKYFYEKARQKRQNHGQDIKVYIKIMDYMLKGNPQKEALFQEKMGQVCDILNVECLNDASPDVDYSKFGAQDYERSRRGLEKESAEVCPRVFYEAILSHEGQILACCHDFWYSPNQLVMGNLKTENFVDVWNGDKFNALRVKLLEGRTNGSICSRCTEYKGLMTKEDNIDSKREELKSFYRRNEA